MNLLKRIFLYVLILAVILIGGFYIFINYASESTKKEFYQFSGLNDSEVLGEIDMSNYIDVNKISARNKMFGGFVFNGSLKNTHESNSVSTVDLYFNFYNGDREERTFHKTIEPGKTKLFRFVFEDKKVKELKDWGVQKAK